MTLIHRVWHTVVGVMALHLAVSPASALLPRPPLVPVSASASEVGPRAETPAGGAPRFRPPAANPRDPEFRCEYPAMEGWSPCSTAEDRECWLRHEDGRQFNLSTNYEDFAPVGITRNYVLDVSSGVINADGQPLNEGKMFNGSYPGPWLEACWGDTLNITVVNNLKENGTSIHWHGIRQNGTMDMDGVNGITQCAIAPGSSFTYSFKAVQYGTSWYHSHYSVQYADGLQGPLTIHGPTSAPFDESKSPLLMTDWAHESAFRLLFNRTDPNQNQTILLNGAGNVSHYGYTPTLDVPPQYEIRFDKTPVGPASPGRPKRYLLRLINTSFDSIFVFSIDNHRLQVVTSDFVPIEPYTTTSVHIGIGQRYNVIVEADPQGSEDGGNPVPEDGSFWIRTWVPDGCGTAPGGEGYEETGILRYGNGSSSAAAPTSRPWGDVSRLCADEPYESLRPKLPWKVGPAANGVSSGEPGEQFNVTLESFPENSTQYQRYPLAAFSLQPKGSSVFNPLQINYSDPTIAHLDEPLSSFPRKWVTIPEDYDDEAWVYLVLTMEDSSLPTQAHPIHLHGHDFAILQQVSGQTYDPSLLDLKLDNPPRRDVVLLPTGGFVVIAFKADNPGSWLMHCHIARHASEGLALQILERQADAAALFPPDSPRMLEAERVCDDFRAWHRGHPELFEGDSGV